MQEEGYNSKSIWSTKIIPILQATLFVVKKKKRLRGRQISSAMMNIVLFVGANEKRDVKLTSFYTQEIYYFFIAEEFKGRYR